jgi:hypothetical protein
MNIRADLVRYFDTAAGFCRSMSSRDSTRAEHARCLLAVVGHIKSLADDNATLERLATCGLTVNEEFGVLEIPASGWNRVIHCDSDDPAAWFVEWAAGVAAAMEKTCRSVDRSGPMSVCRTAKA